MSRWTVYIDNLGGPFADEPTVFLFISRAEILPSHPQVAADASSVLLKLDDVDHAGELQQEFLEMAQSQDQASGNSR